MTPSPKHGLWGIAITEQLNRLYKLKMSKVMVGLILYPFSSARGEGAIKHNFNQP